MATNMIFEQDGEFVLKENIKKYSVYLLFKNKTPIYVGCSSRVENRIIDHKRDKDFDSYCVYQSAYRKREALNIERSVTYILSHFANVDLVNVSGTVKTKHIHKPKFIKSA